MTMSHRIVACSAGDAVALLQASAAEGKLARRFHTRIRLDPISSLEHISQRPISHQLAEGLCEQRRNRHDVNLR
jgi:hypothetical protein